MAIRNEQTWAMLRAMEAERQRKRKIIVLGVMLFGILLVSAFLFFQ